MSRSWYAETKSWASVSKAKRERVKARRAANGKRAPRGKAANVRLRRQFEAAEFRVEMDDFAHALKKAGVPTSTSRAPKPRPEKTD